MIHKFAIGQTDFGITTTASFTGPININISAGTTSVSSDAFTFSNSNGVTFGIDTNAVITASVQTNYLTTAMASNRGSDFVQATANFFGTNASGTIASNAISVSVNPPTGITNINISGGTTSSNVSAVTFKDSNGVSFGYDGSNVTATIKTDYQSSGAYLTTAMASNRGSDFVQATAAFAGTNASGTINSTGISVSIGNYLTTAMASNRGSDFVQATAVFHGTNASGTIASGDISVSVAAPTNNSINISAGTTSSNVTAVTFLDSNGISFGYDGTNITGTVKTNYLTTAMASNRGSDFVQATAVFHGTNASGTIASGDISVSVAAPSAQSINVSAGTTSNNLTALTFSNSNNVSFGLNGSTLTATVTVASTQGSINLSAGTTSNLASAFTFSNSNNVSFGLNGSTITATATVASTQGSINVSAGTTSSNISAITFSNGSGVSFGFDGTNVTATVKTNYLTTAPAALTVSDFLTSLSLGTMVLDLGNIGDVQFQLSTATGGQATLLGNIIIPVSANVNTNTVFTLQFANSNNVSWGLAAGGVITASVATGLTNIRVSAGTLSQLRSAVTFADSNGVTFGLNTNGVVTATVATTYAGTGFTSATTAGTAIVGTLNTSGLSLGVPAYLTAAAAAPITFSASNTSYALSNILFANSNGVSFGLGAGGNSSVISASIASTYAGTGFSTTSTAGKNLVGTLDTAGLNLGVPGWVTLGFAASNSQTLYSSGTVGISEGGGAITIASSTSAAGGQSFMFSVPQTSSMIGVSGISVSTNGSTISVYPRPVLSYFENFPMLDAASITLSASGSVLQVVPFVLQAAASIGFIRLPVSMSYVSTEASGTTANSTWTVNRSYTDVAAIMTQNTGASSLSLAYLTSSSATWVFQNQIQAGANGSRYTVTQNVSYPISGTTSNYTTSYPQSSANVQISSASMTLFTGPRWLDIPFAVSLSAGNYWLAVGRSTNSATQAGNAALGAASMGMSLIGVSQNNLSFGFPGAATNSSIQLQPGLGSWSTNAAVMSTSSMGLASISAMSSGPKPYFQFVRFA